MTRRGWRYLATVAAVTLVVGGYLVWLALNRSGLW